MTTKCRAKDPVTCWKHGTQQGIVANQRIQEVLTDPLKGQFLSDDKRMAAPLKEMTAAALTVTIMNFVETNPTIDTQKVKDAIFLAAYLHRKDMRSNRGQYDKTPYIEHPLRNTLRAIRYGCTSETVLLGSILHDTVEDHPYEISTEFYDTHNVKTEEEARGNSYSYLENVYGKELMFLVQKMSNPITSKYMPASEKNKIYANHVQQAIEYPDVCVAKVCDFLDNAGSLHHNVNKGISDLSIRKKTAKYLPVCDILTARLYRDFTENKLPVTRNGLNLMVNNIQSTKKRLLLLATI